MNIGRKVLTSNMKVWQVMKYNYRVLTGNSSRPTIPQRPGIPANENRI